MQKIIRTRDIQRIIYNFKCYALNKIILIKSFILYDCFRLIYAYLNEWDKVRECYGCLKMMIQDHLYVGIPSLKQRYYIRFPL